MKLNLGSGPHYAEGWTNVDMRSEYARPPDVVANVFHLRNHFDRDTFSACYMGHFLEHLSFELIPDAMVQVKKVLAPGAEVMVVGPCIEKCIETHQPEWLLRQVIANADPDKPGAGHEWTPTTLLTRIALWQSGFDQIEEIDIANVAPPEWPNPTTAEWQCAIRCVNP